MSEQHSTPIETREQLGGDAAQPTPPIVPLQRTSVQWTITGLGILCLTGILWAGRTTFWPDPPQQEPARPSTLLQIDINQASVREFALLPSVGPVLARRIVTDRAQNGPFASVGDLSRVHGIGPKKIDQIAVFCLPVDANESRIALAND